MHSHTHVHRPSRAKGFGEAIRLLPVAPAPLRVRRDAEIMVDTGPGWLVRWHLARGRALKKHRDAAQPCHGRAQRCHLGAEPCQHCGGSGALRAQSDTASKARQWASPRRPCQR
jgi:hypothetical protein